ncbi:MAG: type II CRISPR-associated endonuclease Cas1 [Muribaculaceae bacterium]|nr:type II CRISPR-associated endonuclease Cas1 [Muribaculaceae bacterium]
MIKRTLYFGNPAYLSLRNAQMVLRLPDDSDAEYSDLTHWGAEPARTFPIEDLGLVILDNKRITVTQGLLERLMENNCAVVTCDSTNMPAGLLLPLDAHNIQHERFMEQLSSSKPLRKQLWQQTVQAKIANQARVLYRLTGAEVGNMLTWAENVRSDDAMNLEARAAAYYWRNLFPEFPQFKREREGDPPNNLLNYGYAILRAVVARSLVGKGLLPTLGIHHHNRYNAYCLADDIMEPYRPAVDELVKDIVGNNSRISELTVKLKQQLLSLPTTEVRIAGHRSPLMAAVETTTASLQKCFAGEIRKIVYPEL